MTEETAQDGEAGETERKREGQGVESEETPGSLFTTS